MKKIILIISMLVAGSLFSGSAQDYSVPTDMFLYYGGCASRNPYRMTTENSIDYVRYIDEDGCWHWFFDGFLMLEIWSDRHDGGYGFASGYSSFSHKPCDSADQKVWEGQLNYYYDPDQGLDALEEAARQTAEHIGDPVKKIAVFFFVPEPIAHQNWADNETPTKYWGEVDGKDLDFVSEDDRFLACKWWVEQHVERFNAKGYKYLELAGFYWMPEHVTQTTGIVSRVGELVNSKGYAFTWIPYFHADGYNHWNEYGFNYAYYQPNYFFREMPVERVKVACAEAENYHMYMEMEFDGAVLKSRGDNCKADKLRAYMKGFEDSGAWQNQIMAYYAEGLRPLKASSDPDDQALYREFCEWVIYRPARKSH